MVSFTLNNRAVAVDADPRTPLLWAIRDHVGLTGTKYGCGAGLCGACTIHIDGVAQRSCQLDLGSVAGKRSSPSRDFQRIPRIPCRRPGSPKRCRNAATANRARS